MNLQPIKLGLKVFSVIKDKQEMQCCKFCNDLFN